VLTYSSELRESFCSAAGSAVEAPGFSRANSVYKKGGGFSRCGMDFPERIFFITSVAAQRRLFFSCERAAKMFLDTLCAYRDRGTFQLHEFVVMPDHVHLILAPKSTIALERAMQLVKGGYSHRYMNETGSRTEIWERSFTNHRIRDWEDYEKHRR
jgi:REP element-mobilizing transposase RayT